MILENFTVTDKVALVTGAGQGIGRSIAVGLAASSASSWVTGTILNVDGGPSVPAVQIPVPPLEPRATR
jgi:NAD(P)-dependent dehydrogenase (short-subunit alcohol dehydrogenase family)